MSHSGIVFLDKPLGWSSRQAVNAVVRLLSPPHRKRLKAGHGGTLDPMATGMLPVLLGEATRFAGYGLNSEKQYRVEIDLSLQTDTLDREGEVVARYAGEQKHAGVGEADVRRVLEHFVGEIEQVPPAYSAIRVDGRRAYDAARAGDKVQLEPRLVTVHAIEMLAFDYPRLMLDVRCSKGTYIRSLARDIGSEMGLGGCVTSLRRTSTGGWPAAMMVSLEELEERGWDCVMPLALWLRDLHRCDLDQDQARRFLQGQRIQLDETYQGEASVFCDDILLGNAELKPGMRRMVLHPKRILPSAQQRFL